MHEALRHYSEGELREWGWKICLFLLFVICIGLSIRAYIKSNKD